VIAFWPPPAEPGWWIVVGVVVVSSLGLYARLAAGMRSRGMGALRLPVLLYVGAISIMVAVVLGHLFETSMPQLAALSAAVGALLFYGSDGLIGWTRFVGSLPNARVAIMITYHLGQLGLVLSLTAWLSAGS
jgi:uncharacterized membrane protein YhhN